MPTPLRLMSLLLLSPTLLPAQDRPAAGSGVTLHAMVHPGVELMATLMWLAGRYPPPADSRYKTELWARFGSRRDDPAVIRIRALGEDLYPDLTEVGLLLSICGASAGVQPPRAPAQVARPDSSSWFRLHPRDTLLPALEEAVRFAERRGFCAFHRAHQREYDSWARGLELDLARREALSAVTAFYRGDAARGGSRVTIYLEPLNNWGAHAIDFQRLAGEAPAGRIAFQLGPDADGGRWPDSPIHYLADDAMVATVWHEVSHVCLAPLLATRWGSIDSLDRLFDRDNPRLRQQSISTWRYAFEENLVRGVVAALIRQARGEDAYRRELKAQTDRGFVHVAGIAALLSERYAGDSSYGSLSAFLPEILASLGTQAGPGVTPVPP